MMRSCLLVGVLLASSLAVAKFQIPSDDKVMTHLGQCQGDFLPGNFELFVWNIKKAEAKDAWAKDFEHFTAKSDVVLIQEAMIDSYMPNVVTRQQNFCWNFAASFIDKDQEISGVMNGSHVLPLSAQFLRSPGREPVIKTPKMVLVHEYAIANAAETLLVANIHGLNFTADALNREQIEQVKAVLAKHKGPLIFAGDFNSWNSNRLSYLDEILGSIGMSKVSFEDDKRTFKLDHIYVRGLGVMKTTLHRDIKTSDHSPISASFRLQ
ncbi:hypothetical protein D3C87_103080 [compost metagenome]